MTHFVRRTAAALAVSALMAGIAMPAAAYQVFFGEDLNGSASKRLAATPNAAAASAAFQAALAGVGTEDFEGFGHKASGPLALSFPGAGTATLSGGNGGIAKVGSGKTNGVGRYPTSGRQFLEVEAGGSGSFTVAFSEPVAAFGFWGIDIGDFGGQLVLELNYAGNTRLTVDNSVGRWGSTDGSVLFFGLIAEGPGELFTKAVFQTSTGHGDYFGFDDMTVGTLAQVVDPGPVTAVPEPSILALLGAGTLGIGLAARRRRTIA
jgi:hypothetical protein